MTDGHDGGGSCYNPGDDRDRCHTITISDPNSNPKPRSSPGSQNRYLTRSLTSSFFCPTFFTAAILLASGFGFTSFCLWRLSCHKTF